jgi:hypothetical protein
MKAGSFMLRGMTLFVTMCHPLTKFHLQPTGHPFCLLIRLIMGGGFPRQIIARLRLDPNPTLRHH